MKHALFLIITSAISTISAQSCCTVYPEATTDQNGLSYATINGGDYAGFQLNESEVITYTRKLKFWIWNPGIYKICATTTNTNGQPCKTCIFYEWDTINARVAECINPEWIDTLGVYIVTGSPVCGCDGIEYADEWRARRHGVTKYAVGPCCVDSTTVTVPDVVHSQTVAIYPNPAISDFVVSAYQLEVVQLYNSRGVLIQRVECMSDTVILDGRELAAGTYYAVIQADGKTSVKTITFVRP